MLPKRFCDSKQYKPIEESTRSTTVGCWRCLALFNETSKIAKYPFLTRLALMLNLYLYSRLLLHSRQYAAVPFIEALYHPILQGSESETLSPDQPEDAVDARLSTKSAAHTKVQWIFFTLGCSVLLPWNGEYTSCSPSAMTKSTEDSYHHCNAILC